MSGAEVVERTKEEEGRKKVASWVYTTIGDFIAEREMEVQTGPFGTQLRASDYVEHGIPVINVKNVGYGGLKEMPTEFLTERKAATFPRHRIEEDDIIFGRKGAVDRHLLARQTHVGWVQGSDCIRLRVKSNRVLPKYLSYQFQLQQHRQWMLGQSGNKATMASLNQDIISRIPVVLPSLDDQLEVADLLSAYDDLIENNRRRIVLLEALARNLYQEWFVRLRFPGWETTKIVDGVPEGWESKKLNQIASYLNRGVAPTYDASGDIWVINQKCVRDNRVNLTLGQSQSKKVSEEKLIRHGDILVNSTGTGTLGRVAQVWSNPENTTVDSHVTIVRPSPDVQPLWLGFTLFPLQKLLEDMGEGATNQKELKRTRLGDIAILWPADGLRNEFEHCVAPMVKMIQILDDQNRALSRARDILLPRLMSGELEP